MASIPVDISTYLDPFLANTAGTDLFEGPAPEKPDALVAITHYTGESALDRVMGPSLTEPGVEVALVQVLVRNTVMATAKTNADVIHALLDNFDGTISSRKYFQIESLNGPPFSIGQDREKRWRYVSNYRCKHAR